MNKKKQEVTHGKTRYAPVPGAFRSSLTRGGPSTGESGEEVEATLRLVSDSTRPGPEDSGVPPWRDLAWEDSTNEYQAKLAGHHQPESSDRIQSVGQDRPDNHREVGSAAVLPENISFNVTSDQYGRSPDAKDVLGMFLTAGLTGGFTYQGKMFHDFGDESQVDSTGLTLMRDVATYREHGPDLFARVYSSDRVMVYAETYSESGYLKIMFKIAATNAEDRELIRKQLVGGLVKHKKPVPPDKITVNFWRQDSSGGDYFSRDIDYSPWKNIAHNYSGEARGVLNTLIEHTPETINKRGKMLLLYGPAGTGKTTLLCSLAHAWKEWAYADYIIDPEVFLNSPGYMVDVLLGKTAGNEKYRLVILEDSGELIKDSAKHTTGQALSRLLNLTDGMLGSGRKILIAITTNEKIDSLHPAVTRAGRCLVNANVGKLSAEESKTWLHANDLDYSFVRDEMTLAELYNHKFGGEGKPLGTDPIEPVKSGQYL